MAFYCNACHEHICPVARGGTFHNSVRSNGQCEICGELANCVDCHRYDARLMSAEDQAYIKAKQDALIESRHIRARTLRNSGVAPSAEILVERTLRLLEERGDIYLGDELEAEKYIEDVKVALGLVRYQVG